jgi:hypothetical protein
MSHISVPGRGYVALVLLQNRNSAFYLQIPIDTINRLCLKPCKYLLFLGWCILGVEGALALGDDEIDTDEDLDDRGIYHYIPDEDLGTLLS